MQYRKLNKIDKEVSLLGFGTMRYPMKGKEIDKKEAFRMMDYAYERGVNYFDTAWFYHDGKSENILGEWIKTIDRSTITLVDKLPIWKCDTLNDVKDLFNKQLEKLDVDYIDFYLCHALNKKHWNKFKELEVMPYLEELKENGIIKHIGFSFHSSLEDFEYIVSDYDWEVALIQLNYMDTEYQQGIKGYEMLKERQIETIIMEPLKGGRLAGFAPDVEAIFKEYNPNVSIASWSLRWLASLDNVKTILSGMSSYDQVDDNLNTLSNFTKMTREELEIVEKVKQEILSRSKVDCTSCKYCIPCPVDVKIPNNFGIYNRHAMYQNDNETVSAYKHLLKVEGQADKCIDCGVCIEKCPQNLDIPKLLKEVDEHMKTFNL